MKRIHTKNTQLISEYAPFAVVEAYKSLRTNLQFTSINNNYKKIMITSSIPGEEKSTIAINLALTLANDGKRVLIIDTDLRKPSLQRYFHLKGIQSIGLTNILTDPSLLQQGIIRLRDSDISVIVSGPIPPNPTEMLGCQEMHHLISEVEKDYDFIIFDSPPVSVVTDAAVLSKWCDGVILVIKQKFTQKETAMMAKRNLLSAGANIIGCVLSDFKASQSNHSYFYYQYKNYSKHYA